jgi:hypothetical protein
VQLVIGRTPQVSPAVATKSTMFEEAEEDPDRDRDRWINQVYTVELDLACTIRANGVGYERGRAVERRGISIRSTGTTLLWARPRKASDELVPLWVLAVPSPGPERLRRSCLQ